MPSTSKKQAMLMSALAHGWHPDHPRHKMPPLSVAKEFHAADKAEGKYMHAGGGQVESALEQFTGSPAESGRSMEARMPGLGYMTHLKTPYIPVAGVTRNVFAHLKGATEKLPKLASKVKLPGYHYKFDVGGEVRLGADAISAVKDALSHLANRDASSAAATLTSSRAAMQHPGVAQAAQQLRRGQGIAQASQVLTGLANADTERTVMPTFRRGGRPIPRRGQR